MTKSGAGVDRILDPLAVRIVVVDIPLQGDRAEVVDHLVRRVDAREYQDLRAVRAANRQTCDEQYGDAGDEPLSL